MHPTAEVSEQENRKCPLGKQRYNFKPSYTDPECHTAQYYRQTDRQSQEAIIYCVRQYRTIGLKTNFFVKD